MDDEGVGVMGQVQVQDPHPHTDLGAATLFALLLCLMVMTRLSSSLVVMGEALVLL
jgi:hypothetical protein